jgi:diguanylate cyclase (GGDEF)-like protein
MPAITSLRRSPLGTSAFVTLLLTTLTGAVAAALPMAAPATLTLLGRTLEITLVSAGGLLLARNHFALRRALAERSREESEARAAALTDELTGLYNRRGFRTLAEHQLRIARRTGADVLVLYVDVNDFKRVNDRFGHAAGDAALREIGELLCHTVRETDVVARLGGDEFAVLVVDADASTESAVRSRLTNALAARNARRDRAFPLAFSLGVAHLDDARAATLEELVEAADRAMYAAKRRRRARVS